jgi:hypothetical protein
VAYHLCSIPTHTQLHTYQLQQPSPPPPAFIEGWTFCSFTLLLSQFMCILYDASGSLPARQPLLSIFRLMVCENQRESKGWRTCPDRPLVQAGLNTGEGESHDGRCKRARCTSIPQHFKIRLVWAMAGVLYEPYSQLTAHRGVAVQARQST